MNAHLPPLTLHPFHLEPNPPFSPLKKVGSADALPTLPDHSLSPPKLGRSNSQPLSKTYVGDAPGPNPSWKSSLGLRTSAAVNVSGGSGDENDVFWETSPTMTVGRSSNDPDGDVERFAGGPSIVVGGELVGAEKGRLGVQVPYVENGRRPSKSLKPVTIAVVGHPGVGRTSLVKRAFRGWGLTSAKLLQVSPKVELRTAQPVLKDAPQEVWVYEVDLLTVGSSAEVGELQWPSCLPVSIEVLVVCYDAGNKDSWAGIENILKLKPAQLPYCVFALKSSGVPRPIEIKPEKANAVVGGLIEVSLEEDKLMHMGFSWVLREARNRRYGESPSQSRAASTQASPAIEQARLPSDEPRPSFESESSVFSLASQQRLADKVHWRPSDSESTCSDRESSSKNTQKTMRTGVASVGSNDQDKLGNVTHFTFQELVDQLFYHAVCGKYDFFQKVFFWVYRRFARPIDVITLFRDTFLDLNNKKLAGLHAQLKLCGLLNYWITTHPSDFASPSAKDVLLEVFELIAFKPSLAHHASHLLRFRRTLPSLVPETLPWAIAEGEASDPAPRDIHLVPLKPKPSISILNKHLLVGLTIHQTTSDDSDVDGDGDSTNPPPTAYRRPSVVIRKKGTEGRGTVRNPSADRASSVTYLPISNPAGGNGKLSSGSQTSSMGSAGDPWHSLGLTKVVNRFMECSDMQIANDLTRLIWFYFIKVKPRHVLNHVLSGQESVLGESMKPLYKISSIFNDVSNLFVAILYSQSKLKARVKVYERIINIIHYLRTQNNYVGLLGGITAVSELWLTRLKLTKKLVEENMKKTEAETVLYKKFQSHSRLVDSRGNYKNYRVAVREDESLQRKAIPLMPVIITDMVKVSQVMDDRRKPDDLINWTKFDKYGQVLNAMVGYQQRGCPVPPSVQSNVVSLMLKDKPDFDDQTLFRRCDYLQNEENNHTTLSSTFRRFLSTKGAD